MGAYQYVAVDPGGKEHRGVLEGDTPRHVRQLLRDRQLLPVEVAEVEARERKAKRSFSLFRGISGLDLAMLTRQLATLVKAGLPLDEALLAVRMLNVRVKRAVFRPRVTRPISGVRSSQWCTRRRICSCRRSRTTITIAAITPPAIRNHQFWTRLETQINARVIMGSSWPVVSNTLTTFGTTTINITVTMISAIAVSRIG